LPLQIKLACISWRNSNAVMRGFGLIADQRIERMVRARIFPPSFCLRYRMQGSFPTSSDRTRTQAHTAESRIARVRVDALARKRLFADQKIDEPAPRIVAEASSSRFFA
jgi:hypothetical protein